MKRTTINKLAKPLQNRIERVLTVLSTNRMHDDYLQMTSESQQATHEARYIAEHVMTNDEDRRLFLALCGLRSESKR